MLTHKELWAAIDQLAKVNGYSASGLAKKAGLDPTSFNKSKRKAPDGKPRWPSTESLSKVLAATNSTMSEFLGLMNGKSAEGSSPAPAPQQVEQAQARTVPLLQDTLAENPSVFTEEGAPISQNGASFTLPEANANISSQAWALLVTGSAFAPYFQEGDILLIDPEGPTRAGDPFLIRRRSEEKLAIYRGQSAEPPFGESLGRIMTAYYSLVDSPETDDERNAA